MESVMTIEGTKPETITEIKNTILAILESPCEEKTIRVALKALIKSVKALPPITVKDCTLYGDRPYPVSIK